jgi:hypothetical protein
MPMHDWTRVIPGSFHHFHRRWISAISDLLNSGRLPPGYFALAEQIVCGPIPDVITLDLPSAQITKSDRNDAVTLVRSPPQARFIVRSKAVRYAQLANRVTVRHGSGRVVAMVEIVSPGNTYSHHAFRSFVEKAINLLCGWMSYVQ